MRVFDDSEANTLLRLSSAVDRLWQRHIDSLRSLRTQTANMFSVWGHSVTKAHEQTPSTQERNALWDKALNPKGGAASDYQRLKLVMDYWCALWFWPIDEADLLPSRHEFLFEVGCLSKALCARPRRFAPRKARSSDEEQPSLTLGQISTVLWI